MDESHLQSRLRSPLCAEPPSPSAPPCRHVEPWVRPSLVPRCDSSDNRILTHKL
jgi:hypothetical protein